MSDEVETAGPEHGIYELFVGLLAYQVENDEAVNVSEETMLTIMKAAVETGTVPELAIHNKDGRAFFAVRLSKEGLEEE